MALLFMDSWDFYATADLPRRWLSAAGATISPGTGRRGTQSLRLADGGTVELAPGGDPTAILCGFACRSALAAAGPIWYLWDPVNGRNQVLVAQGTDGRLSALRGGASATPGDATGATLLGTSASGITADTYAYVEIAVRLHPSAGSVVLRVDRVEVLTLASVNTVAIGGGYFTTMGLRGAGGGTDVDDLYIADPSGPAPWNALLGDCQVDARRPIAAGGQTGWLPVGGANWQTVADAAPDADATYNAAASVGAVDTYKFAPVPIDVTTVLGVQHNLDLRKTDTAACIVAPVVSRAGVLAVSDHQFSPGLAYGYARHLQSVNPATGRLWLPADVNAAEFGVKRLA